MTKTLRLHDLIGCHISTAIDRAKELAAKEDCIVCFEFNGCDVNVSANTNTEHLLRDFDTHYILDWKEIGPDCIPEYSQDLKDEIHELKTIQQAKAALSSAEYAHKEGAKRRELANVLNGVELQLKDPELWQKGLSNNTDGYGAAIYQYAEQWAKLMQIGIADGHKIQQIAEDASYKADTVGLSGFQYGAAVGVLSACWVHGEDLRKWHNKKYGVSEDKEGVVNPAILTIGGK